MRVAPTFLRLTTAAMLVALGTVALPSETTAQGFAAAVGVDPVVEEPFTQTLPVLGRFVARYAGDVATQVEGPVSEIDADVGDRVRTGDPLLQISGTRMAQTYSLRSAELSESQASVEAATAELITATQEMDRIRGLRGSSAFSQARLEDAEQATRRAESLLAVAEAQLLQSQTMLDQALLDLEDSTIRAPYDGIVTERLVSPGNYVRIGDPVVRLINDQDLEIEAQIGTARLTGLTPGREVTARLDDGRTVALSVRAVVPEEDPLSRTRPVRFEMIGAMEEDGVAIAGNQSITLDIPIAEARAVVSVHKDALQVGPGGSSLVYLVVDGIAQPRNVTIGESVGNRFEVLSGLAEGDVAVVRGNERLRPGQEVSTGGPPGGRPAGPAGGDGATEDDENTDGEDGVGSSESDS